MISQYKMEFIVGLLMIAGILALSALAFKISGLSILQMNEVYHIKAEFDHIGDLKVRAPVTIAGVSIGRVIRIDLDAETYKALVVMEVSETSQIPIDSTANIFTAGLIGSNYISIEPGFEETYLKDGDLIEKTNQALILQNLIGRLLFHLENADSADSTQ